MSITIDDLNIWVIETGEDCEGGRIIGLYLTPELAAEDFLTEAAALNERFTSRIDEAKVTGEALYLHAGCDWLSLRPHQVVTRSALTGRALGEWMVNSAKVAELVETVRAFPAQRAELMYAAAV